MAVGVLFLTNYHLHKLGLDKWQAAINFVGFLWLTGQLGLAHFNKRFQTSPEDVGRVVVIIPVYNEDPGTFSQTLLSLDFQSRSPDRIVVIDDGSSTNDCQRAFEDWVNEKPHRSDLAVMIRQDNAGKREAQARGFTLEPDADIYVTVDSDTVLAPDAIEEGIKPFSEPKVMSVAGLLLGLNARRNFLTRLIELGFCTSFLSGRSAWSRMKSVAVNCGGLAFYRGKVVHNYLEEYLGQKVFGKTVTSGDDRILTNFALLEGWTVFQESSVAYTLHPYNLTHLTKQRIRWWRSFFWGGEWLLRRFPPTRLIWWLVLGQFITFAFYTVVLPYMLIVLPLTSREIPWAFFIYVFVALAYLRNIRFIAIKRTDISLWQQLGIYLLSPLCVLLNTYLCSILQYAGLFTVKKTGWSTREKVEVTS